MRHRWETGWVAQGGVPDLLVAEAEYIGMVLAAPQQQCLHCPVDELAVEEQRGQKEISEARARTTCAGLLPAPFTCSSPRLGCSAAAGRSRA